MHVTNKSLSRAANFKGRGSHRPLRQQNAPRNVQPSPTSPAPPAGPSSKARSLRRQSLVTPEGPDVLTAKNKHHLLVTAGHYGKRCLVRELRQTVLKDCTSQAWGVGTPATSHRTVEAASCSSARPQMCLGEPRTSNLQSSLLHLGPCYHFLSFKMNRRGQK